MKKTASPKVRKKTTGLTKKRPKKRPIDEKTDFPKLKSVLFKPERLKYVRKLVRAETCVFCDAFQGGTDAEKTLFLGQNTHAMAILNKYPYNTGHLLVLPKRHVGDFRELSKDELVDMQLLLQKAITTMTEVYTPSGFNVGLNLGAAAGAGIPEHMHWHLVPRWLGDTNFFPLIADTKVVVETLESSFERLVAYFR